MLNTHARTEAEGNGVNKALRHGEQQDRQLSCKKDTRKDLERLSVATDTATLTKSKAKRETQASTLLEKKNAEHRPAVHRPGARRRPTDGPARSKPRGRHASPPVAARAALRAVVAAPRGLPGKRRGSEHSLEEREIRTPVRWFGSGNRWQRSPRHLFHFPRAAPV